MHAQHPAAGRGQHVSAGDLRPADNEEPIDLALEDRKNGFRVIHVPAFDDRDPMTPAEVVDVNASGLLRRLVIAQRDDELELAAYAVDLFHAGQPELYASNESKTHAHVSKPVASDAGSRRCAG